MEKIRDLKKILGAEIEQITFYLTYIMKIRENHSEKESLVPEDLINDLNNVSLRLKELSLIRRQIIEEMANHFQLPEPASMQDVLSQLDREDRTEIQESVVLVRTMLLKAKSQTNRIESLVKNKREMLDLLMNSVRKPRHVYHRHEHSSSAINSPIWVSKEL